MFTCICLGTNDLKRASHFYDAALAPLGIQRCGGVEADTGDVLGWGTYPDAGTKELAAVCRGFTTGE